MEYNSTIVLLAFDNGDMAFLLKCPCIRYIYVTRTLIKC